MRHFRIILFYELKKNLNYKNLIIFFFIMVLVSYSFKNGLDKYKNTQFLKSKFIEVEKIEFNQFINYLQYGTHGFRVYFYPASIVSYFHNSTIFSNIEAKIDSGAILNILNTFKGNILFKDKTGGFKDFSGIIFMFGSLMSLVFGFKTFFNRDQIIYLNEFISHRKYFLIYLISRGIILFVFFVFLIVPSIVLNFLGNIKFSIIELKFLLYYFIVLAGMNIFFFLIGIIIGILKPNFVGFTLIIIVWFISIFIIPGVISSIIAARADNITSVYQLELNKLEVLMDFEKRAIEKAGVSKNEKNNTQIERDIIEGYYNHEFVQLLAFEKKMEREIENNISVYHFLSSLFPSTLYFSTGNEVSSRGYNSFLDFYRYIQMLKRQFVRFYFDKKFYSNFPKMEKSKGSDKVRFAKVESFVKNDENIFRSKPSLPKYFGLGMTFLFSYIIILFIISYIRFKTILKR